ncbi:uncharacterized protein LOC132838599 isoform X2 [Tachysurus vachellii]|uniref:uncharacterized protein LOC132838599 isoform X2 n=1 Tax=Tachysurus vachellii TaxID=175792 RepID=UPI00296AE045|nr:uncharacterized protein LOC132838599 isoform X2 [Tachysurus vachellii]
MVFGTKTVFLRNQPEQLLNVQNGIMDRLKRRVEIQLVNSVDSCDVSIVFVPIVSRAGTDIEAALRTIPTSPQQSVVLIVIHHTHDVNYIAPVSKWSVKREGVFAVDFLGHEDCGLLTCLANDMALKSLADYLAPAAPDTPQLLPNTPRCQRHYWIKFVLCALVFLCIVLLIVLSWFFVNQPRQGNNHTPPTTTMEMPNITLPITTPLTTQQPNVTVSK